MEIVKLGRICFKKNADHDFLSHYMWAENNKQALAKLCAEPIDDLAEGIQYYRAFEEGLRRHRSIRQLGTNMKIEN